MKDSIPYPYSLTFNKTKQIFDILKKYSSDIDINIDNELIPSLTDFRESSNIYLCSYEPFIAVQTEKKSISLIYHPEDIITVIIINEIKNLM